MEVPRVVVEFAGLQPPAGVARARVLDLHHLGAQPSEGFGARRPGLELGEVHDANAFETIELDANAHRRALLLREKADSHALSFRRGPHQRADAAVEILQMETTSRGRRSAFGTLVC